MTEEELINSFAAVVRGERERITKAIQRAPVVNKRVIEDIVGPTAFYFNAIDARSYLLIDKWVREAMGT